MPLTWRKVPLDVRLLVGFQFATEHMLDVKGYAMRNLHFPRNEAECQQGRFRTTVNRASEEEHSQRRLVQAHWP